MANKDYHLQVFLNILFFNHFEVYSSVVLSEFTLLCCVATSKYASCLLHVSGRKHVSGLGLVPSAPWNVPIPGPWAPCNVMLQEASWLICWVRVGVCLPARKERMRSAWRLRWLSRLELAGNQGLQETVATFWVHLLAHLWAIFVLHVFRAFRIKNCLGTAKLDYIPFY